MDYIKSLKAKNVGIFTDLEVNFSKYTNIIIGGNSSGKTTILKIITYCYSNSYMNNVRLRAGASYHIKSQIKNKSYTIGVDNVVDQDQAYRQFKASRWKAPHSDDDSISLMPYNPIVHNLYAIGASRYFDYKSINGMQREAKGHDRIEYYKNTNSQFLDRPLLPDIKQWMINRYFVVEKDWARIEKQNWEYLMQNIKNISPKNLNFSFHRIERDLEPQFLVNGKVSYLEELSSGLKSVIAIIFSITDWIEGVNEGRKALLTNATGTVLIDEIDAHLHPTWQETIVQDLRNFFPKLQFIFTTHSPHIVSTANKNEIIQIPPHDGVLKLKPLNKDFGSWEISDILGELMEVADNDSSDVELIIKRLDIAFDKDNIEEYNHYLAALKRTVHPSDIILKVYEIKKSRLLLRK
jgi:predicted ATP-binding protein involved in virulence